MILRTNTHGRLIIITTVVKQHYHLYQFIINTEYYCGHY